MDDSRSKHPMIGQVGNTPLVELKKIVPRDCARVFIKLESVNPTGSIKDRMALAMIEAAESDGRLRPGGHVVEYTAGSTGVSLAFICAVKGYSLSIVTSDAFSIEKRIHMAAYGAELTLVPSVNGKMDEALTRNMIKRASQIAKQTNGFWTDQLNNADQLTAYHALGEEIWTQTGGRVDAFVHSTGTAATVRGVAETLHGYDKSIHCVAIEPTESAVLSGSATGAHGIEGVGAGFVVPLWLPEAVDEVATVTTEDAMAMARRLASTEGIFAGTSTGADVFKAIELGRRLGPGASIVTIMADSGMKYTSTDLYRALLDQTVPES